MKTARLLGTLGIIIMILGVLDFFFNIVRMHPTTFRMTVYAFETYIMVMAERFFEGGVLIGLSRLIKNHAWQ